MTIISRPSPSPDVVPINNNNNGRALGVTWKDPSFDAESNGPTSTKPVRYPVAVFLIFLTEFCERFSYYGMRAVLTLYLRNALNFSESLATTTYHVFLLLCYALPVLGGILADNWLGKYYTIFYISIVYVLGNITLSVSSIPPLHLPPVPLTLLGLLLIGIGTGGIKPCVLALGGEQFKLPEQAKQLGQFFAIFSFIVNAGSLISTTVTPIFRRDVECFGEDTCYPLAFGAPASIMILAIIIFVCGKRMYKMVPPEGNILVKVIKCISYAACKNFGDKDKNAHGKKDTHWLDRAKNKFDSKLINDTKGITRILIYYLPIPMFWALYEQLGSRWTFQATRMNGVVGSMTIKPDQMMVANSLLMFTLIPVSETIVYPIFRKCGVFKRPLQRMSVGGIFAAISFVLAGVLEMHIEDSATSNIPKFGETSVNIINTLSCPIALHDDTIDTHHSVNVAIKTHVDGITHLRISDHQEHNLIVAANAYHIFRSMDSATSLNFSVTLPENGCKSKNSILINNIFTTSLNLSEIAKKEENDGGIFRTSIVSIQNGSLTLASLPSSEDLSKSKEGNAKIRVVVVNPSGIMHSRGPATATGLANHSSPGSGFNLGIRLSTQSDAGKIFPLNPVDLEYGDLFVSSTIEMDPNVYRVQLIISKSEEMYVGEAIDIRNGGSYMLVLTAEEHPSNSTGAGFKNQLITLTPPNEVHMLWLLPQYVVMACAEILFIISGSEFSFTEAPESMKSVMQSCWHLTNAAGNLIVIFSAQFDVNEATSFFTFAALMVLNTIIFALMARNYKYVSSESKKEDTPGMLEKCAEIEETNL